MAFIGPIETTGSFDGTHQQVATLKSSGGGGGTDSESAIDTGHATSGSFDLIIQTGDIGNGNPFRGTSGSFRIDVKNGGTYLRALRIGAGTYGSFLQTGDTSLNDTSFRITTPTQVEYMRVDPDNTATVFNEGSADLDFRVESNGLTHMLYVDGGNDRVAIGSNAPMAPLDVNDNNDSSGHCIVMRNNDSSGAASQWRAFQIGSSGQFYLTGTSGITQITSDTAGSDNHFYLLGKADHGKSGESGDSIVWFGHENAAGNVEKEAYIGVDGGDHATNRILKIGLAGTFGSGERITINSTETVINESGQDENFRIETNTSQQGFVLDSGQNKIYCGLHSSGLDGITDFSDYSRFTIAHNHGNTLDKTAGSSDNLSDFALELRNSNVGSGVMTGIAFNVNTERDADSIGAAIVAERDSSAGSDTTLYDTNLHFMTSDISDDDNTVRMTINHDGKVQIGNGGGDRSDGTGLVILTSDDLDATADYGELSNYHLTLIRKSNDDDKGPGIAFASSTGVTNVGAAIAFDRKDSNSVGDLVFRTKASTSDGATPSTSMVMTYDGKVGINQASPQAELSISCRQTDTSPESPDLVFDWNGGNAALATGQGPPDSGDVIGRIKATASWTATGLSGAQNDMVAGQLYWQAGENWGQTSTTTQGSTFLLTNRNTGSSSSAYIIYSPGTSKNVILNGSTDPYDTINTDISNRIVCASQIVPAQDNYFDLGKSNARWDDVRATNATIQTSDANLKEQITTSALGLDFICKLRPVSYKWKDEMVKVYDPDDPDANYTEELKTYTRTHYGLIAQEVESVMTELGMAGEDFAGFCSDTHNNVDQEEPETVLSLRYAEFISPIIKAVQELKTENESLKARIEALEP